MGNSDNLIYQTLGSAYKFVPEDLHPLILKAYEMRIPREESLRLLAQLETAIIDHYSKRLGDSFMLDVYYHSREKKWNEKCCLIILLNTRKRVMRKLLNLSEDTFLQFQTINNTLLDLSKETVRKTLALYNSWLTTEDAAWRNDCEVSGVITTDGYKEMESDDTGSDYEKMMEIIEEVSTRELFKVEFSGSPDRIPNKSFEWDFPVDSARLFSGGGKWKKYGDFTMCQAFKTLYLDSLYSEQDILRIDTFWSDVAVVNQRIVDQQGELL